MAIEKRRFWLTFYAGVPGDMRPAGEPSIEWWCSGDREGDPPYTICAIVDAPSVASATRRVRLSDAWPEAVAILCEPKEAGWRPPADRFPPKDV